MREVSSQQSPGRKKVKDGFNVQNPAQDGTEVVRKRGRPRLSAPTPVLVTREETPEPIIRKKNVDQRYRKIRFSNSYLAEYYCNCFDFTTISENRFTNSVVNELEKIVDTHHPLLDCRLETDMEDNDLENFKSTPCVSIKQSEYPPKMFAAQQSIKKLADSEAEQRTLYATIPIASGAFVCEITGLICSSNDLDINERRHSFCPANVSGSSILPPFVFQVPSNEHSISKSLFLDCRDVACSDGRFIQFCCDPNNNSANAIIRSVVVVPDGISSDLPRLISSTKTADSNAKEELCIGSVESNGILCFKICIFATRLINAGEEIIVVGNKSFLHYPCATNGAHGCQVFDAVSAIEDYDHSHTGGLPVLIIDPDIPKHPIDNALLQREKSRMNAIHEANHGGQPTFTWANNNGPEYEYEISIGTDSEPEVLETDVTYEIDDYSIVSKSEILDAQLFLDEESSTKMDIDERSSPVITATPLERPAKLEPRRVSLKDFMRQNSSLATDIPEFVPENDVDVTESQQMGVELPSEQVLVDDDNDISVSKQPEQSSSGGISEHEEGSIKNNSHGDSAEILPSLDHYSATSRPSSPKIYHKPLSSYRLPPDREPPSQIQNGMGHDNQVPPYVRARREPEAGYGYERHDQSNFRSRDSFPPPKRPPMNDRPFISDRRDFIPHPTESRGERPRMPMHVRPQRINYRPDGRSDGWQERGYNPPPREYGPDGQGFEHPPRAYWNEPGQNEPYGWRERYPNEYRDSPPLRRNNQFPIDYRPRFRPPPPPGEVYRPPPPEHFEFRDQRERDGRMYRPYPARPRPDYNRPRQ